MKRDLTSRLMCLPYVKSGNVVVLKVGNDAAFTNKTIVKLIHEVLQANEIDALIVCLLPASRDAVKDILETVDYIDVIIPRGGKGVN